MNQIHKIFSKLGRKVMTSWIGIQSLYRRATFPYLVSWHGGRLEMGRTVQLTHTVKFQGRGTLILEAQVKLGYWLGGALHDPILFQPREPNSVIRIGERTAVVNGCEMIARTEITIGSDCRIGSRCIFIDADFHGIKPNERNTSGISKPIIIGNNVWFGTEAIVLKGVHVGKDAVIGARCVVTKDVSNGAIVAGNPMKIIGSVYA